MWYMTDPEELKNYQCNISLKKAKEDLIRRYSYLNGDNLRHEPEHSLSRSLSPVLRDNLWYTGISSNPLLSLTALLLRCQGATIMQCDIREGGYDLSFDARTSQSGYVHRYLPEEGREGDREALCGLLLHFLRFYKKPRGTKWKYVRKVLASDNMRFVNGMICPD